MELTQRSQIPRSRQACEPCRRKKSKCTAERPICSFCQRLDLPCAYLPRENSSSNMSVNKVSKTRSKKGRIQRLESQVSGIFELVQSLSNKSTSAVEEPPVNHRRESLSNPSSSIEQTTLDPTTTTQEPCIFSDREPIPPSSVLSDLAEVYRQKLHLQPLPLFDPTRLQTRLAVFPQFLLHSFLALILEFSTHEYFRGRETEAIQFYYKSATETTMRLAAEGIPRIEVIQSLCFLALKDIAEHNHLRAWMSIGTASRLEALRKCIQEDPCDNSIVKDISSRCFWSVFMLETIFFPQISTIPEFDKDRGHPPSTDPPLYIPSAVSESSGPDLGNPEDITLDLGINAYCARMISVWGNVAVLLHKIRLGNVEVPWAQDSTYVKLTNLLFEYEAQLPHKHLLRNLYPYKRSPEEIQDQREYWHPWLTTHLILHASLALLNHPFIHLVAMRHKPDVNRSRLFLQQVVDQALFHSGWVCWLLKMFEDVSFEVNCPLLGHAVAAIATIPWLYQFAKDSSVHQKALSDLSKCERFLERVSLSWPHLSGRVESLRKLQLIVKEKREDTANKSTIISIHSSLLWDLLDPTICAIQTDANTSNAQSRDVPDVKMHITTQFVHPVDEDHTGPNAISVDSLELRDPFWSSGQDFQQISMDNYFPFALNDSQ